jgi:uncharacterized protein YgiM (DUF1202 family)
MLAIAALADARTVTVKERARLRAGPSSSTDAVGEVQAGATLVVVGESSGWLQVQTPDGQTGYVWAEHLVENDAEAKPADARRDAPAAPGSRSLTDEVRALREDVSALRARPDPATAADLDRMRAEIERLTAAQQILARRLDDRLLPADPGSPEAPLGGLGPLIFVLGGGVGWAVSRMVQRRRDSRQRNRLRF